MLVTIKAFTTEDAEVTEDRFWVNPSSPCRHQHTTVTSVALCVLRGKGFFVNLIDIAHTASLFINFMIRFTTAGESHGPALTCVLEGIPAGLPLLAEAVNAELARRQQGYGRGRRMQIERDEIEFLSGVRAGETLGSPIAMLIRNRDWKNWQDVMDPAPRESDPDPRRRAVTRPRPGHADLTGLLKYDRDDARDILERASARETTARVAAGAVCRVLLSQFGVRIGSHLVHLGGIDAEPPSL